MTGNKKGGPTAFFIAGTSCSDIYRRIPHVVNLTVDPDCKYYQRDIREYPKGTRAGIPLTRLDTRIRRNDETSNFIWLDQ